MKGEIFKLFEEFVVSVTSEDKFEELYDEVLPSLETQDPFVGPGTYPDHDFFRIVGHVVKTLGLDPSGAVHQFGKFCFPRLLAKLPSSIQIPATPKEFLKMIHDVIHVEVKKVYSGAQTPNFTFQDTGKDSLIMTYQSKRKLYDFVDGMIEGVSEYYQTPISFDRNMILLEGEEACEYHISFQ